MCKFLKKVWEKLNKFIHIFLRGLYSKSFFRTQKFLTKYTETSLVCTHDLYPPQKVIGIAMISQDAIRQSRLTNITLFCIATAKQTISINIIFEMLVIYRKYSSFTYFSYIFRYIFRCSYIISNHIPYYCVLFKIGLFSSDIVWINILVSFFSLAPGWFQELWQ